MDKLPFSVYDFFAYLSSGSVLVITTDYIWSLGLLNQKEVSPILGVALVIVAYVTGHIVAHFAALVLEQGLVHRVLQSPSTLLMGTEPRWRLNWVFRNYYRPLSANVQQRVRHQARIRNCTAAGEGFFQHVYPLVTANERLQARLDDFRNQYGFARNMAFAFLVSSVAVVGEHWVGRNPVRLRWAAIACVAGVTLLYRYLKFFRQYSYELFLRYSALPEPEQKSTRAGA
jgi:hypothetical protein